MPPYLNAVVTARAVDQIRFVNIDRDMVNLHPAFAGAGAASVMIRTVSGAAACILTCKKDKITRLKLARIGKQNAHALAFLSHAR